MSGLSGNDTGGSNSGSFSDMLALMANPAALQAKYAEFAQRQKAAEEAVALVGPAKDIERLRAEAASAKEEAKGLLDAAQARAKTMLEQAQNSADNLVKQAKDNAAITMGAADKALADAAAKVKAAKDAEAASNVRSQGLDKRERELANYADDLDKQSQTFAEREAAIVDGAKRIKYVRDQLMAQLAEHSKYLSAG